MAFKLIARPSGILVPRDDLGLKGQIDRDLVLGDDIGFVAALLLGNDGNQSRLLKVDANGNLRITNAGQVVGGNVVPLLGGAAGSAIAAGSGVGDAQAGFFAALIAATVFNGATWDRVRSASAANLAAQSGLGAALTAGPGQWTTAATPATGSAASASRTAGAAGVRHICTGFMLSASAVVAPALTGVDFNIRDGASGAGTILLSFALVILAAVGQSIPPITVTGLHLVGSPATAMTAEVSAGVANVTQKANLIGYDAV